MSKQTIEEEAIALVWGEKQTYEDATCFVTDKVAFQMRNLIRQLRKNYWGIFDEPIDPTTGRKKIWIPLTRFIVDTAVKNIDIDTKDVNFMSKNPNAIHTTELVRNATKNELDETEFGEDIDDAEQTECIDGTVVWKTIEEKDKEGKYRAVRRQVDILNCYIDPHARSIQEANSFIERSLMTTEELKQMSGWINTDIEGSKNLHPTDDNMRVDGGETPMIEVFERWGLAPKRILTGKKKDNELVPIRIVISNSGGKKTYHFAKGYDGWKPYEESRYKRVPGRWYGVSPAEMVMMLQLWLNTIVNIRINRSYFSQLGIFKVKSNSGITSQTISRLAANGAIVVNSMDDIEQLAMQEASQSSYTDENNIVTWAQRVTSAYESVTGEAMPSSTPATNTVIQQKQAQSTFIMVRKQFAMFLKRWLKRQAIPIIMKNIKAEDVIRLTGDPRVLEELDEIVANKLVYEAVAKMPGKPDPASVERERQRVLEVLKSMGKQRFYKLMEEIDWTEYDVQVVITNEEIDTGVIAQNLIQMLSLFPEARVQIAKQVFDIMGLDSNILPTNVPMYSPDQVPQGEGENEQQMTTTANTMSQFSNSRASA